MRRGKRWLIVQNRVGDRDVLWAVERRLSGQHIVEYDAQGPQVGAAVDRAAPDLLRRHVRHRAHHDARFSEALIARLGQPEVEDPHAAVREQHDVAGLQVAMHDPHRVGGLQPFGNLTRDLETLVNGQAAIAR